MFRMGWDIQIYPWQCGHRWKDSMCNPGAKDRSNPQDERASATFQVLANLCGWRVGWSCYLFFGGGFGLTAAVMILCSEIDVTWVLLASIRKWSWQFTQLALSWYVDSKCPGDCKKMLRNYGMYRGPLCYFLWISKLCVTLFSWT